MEVEVEKLASQDEIHLRQRSRISWLREGDRNSNFFHLKASSRKVLNTIPGLVSSHSDWCSDDSKMGNIVLDYFGEIFTSSNPTLMDMENVLGSVEPIVDCTMNHILTSLFTAKEIHRDLFDMHPDKAPCPNGLSVLFLSKFFGYSWK